MTTTRESSGLIGVVDGATETRGAKV